MIRFAYGSHSLKGGRTLNVAALALSLSAVACSGDDNNDSKLIVTSSQGAALTAVQNTEAALNGILDSGGFLADSTSLAETLSALGAGSTECSSTYVACDANTPDCTAEFVETCTQAEVQPEDLAQIRQDLRDGAAEVVAYLRDNVLIEANVDRSLTTDTHVTYRLGADILCASGNGEGTRTDGNDDVALPEPELNPECVANAERAQLRVRLSQPQPGDVDMTLIVTNNDYEPITVQLYKDRLGLQANLAQGLEVMEALNEDTSSIETLSGLLQLQFIKNAALDYSLQLSVLEDLQALFSDEEGNPISYSMGKSSPTVELRADGNARTISARYNYSAVQYLAPLGQLARLFEDEVVVEDSLTRPEPIDEPALSKTYTGSIDLLIAGYTSTFSYQADSDTFRFSDIGFGDSTSTLKYNDTVLAALDLNADHGRHFDLTVQPQTGEQDGENATLVRVDPTVDLRLAFDFAHVADQIDGIPELLLGETLRMWFEGDAPSFTVTSDQIGMVSGKLHLTSENSTESDITVEEGMCLAEASDQVALADPAETPDAPANEMQPSDSPFGLEVVACE